LGKFVHEVEDELTPQDLAEYLAYYKIKAADEKKAYEKNKPPAKTAPRRKR
jgi:hypothetical protein